MDIFYARLRDFRAFFDPSAGNALKSLTPLFAPKGLETSQASSLIPRFQ
jgi:hypothetical protein